MERLPRAEYFCDFLYFLVPWDCLRAESKTSPEDQGPVNNRDQMEK